MPKLINSVLGEIEVANLKQTLMHEHVVSVNWNMRMCYPDWFCLDEFIPFACSDIAIAQAAGIKTLVDVTPVCLGRDVRTVQKISKMTGMHIIVATGFFHTEQQWMANREMESFLDCIMKDILVGIDGTSIRPGLIKCCTDLQGLSEINQKLLSASAIASKKSGLPISTHASWQNEAGLAQLKVFERYGINPKKVVIGHMGDTNDLSYLLRVLEHGCYIGLDRFGDDAKNPLEKRVETLLRLCEKGYIDQLMVSHDHVCYVDIGPNEWNHYKTTKPQDHTYNFGYFHQYAVPLLLRAGMTQKEIDHILVENPRRYFEQD